MSAEPFGSVAMRWFMTKRGIALVRMDFCMLGMACLCFASLHVMTYTSAAVSRYLSGMIDTASRDDYCSDDNT